MPIKAQYQRLPSPQQHVSQIIKNLASNTRKNVKTIISSAFQKNNSEIQNVKKCPHNLNVPNLGKNNSRRTSSVGKKITNSKICVHHRMKKTSNSTNNTINNNTAQMKTVASTNTNKLLTSNNINTQNKSGNTQPKNKSDQQKATNIVEKTKEQENTNNANKEKIQNKKLSTNANGSIHSTPQKSKISEIKPIDQDKNEKSNKELKPKNCQQQKEITELYTKNERTSKSSFDSVFVENVSFQKVTQELADIIKNFQKQMQEVSQSKNAMEEVPSAMIKPKIKEFFKNIKLDTKTLDQNSCKAENKNQQSSGHCENKNSQFSHSTLSKSLKSSTSNVSKRSSLKSLPTNFSSNSNVRKFSSLTSHTLSTASSSTIRRMNRLSTVNIDPLKQLKDEVQKAIRERKTFTVRGHYETIRRELLSRGWIEKFHVTYKDHLSDELKRFQNYSISELLPLIRREDLSAICKRLIKSKLLGSYQVDFYWGINNEAFKENPEKVKFTTINKLKRDIFSYTNKQGLCDASKISHWYQKTNVSKLNHPRTYSLGKNGDLAGFIQDFNLTAAMSLLKWVVKIHSTNECKVLSPFGKIPLETFDFALNECCKFIKKGRHEDIDMQIPEAKEQEWNKFLDYFYKLVHFNNHFKDEGTDNEESLFRKSNYILNNLRTFYPYVDMDGMMNIWILKPTASSRGRGIHMCRTLQYVLKVIKQNQNVRYIIQKYIERPLLIYNTKFDIRQWFLISNCSPLTIWMYKECYLRFSSQTYNLRKLHESIHLTNNSVQCKYKNNSNDAALPNYNMWDSSEFKTYLTNIGFPNTYEEIIYPGMKQCITAAVLMHQDKMVIRRNCFELYGADFILTEDFKPWLLEINSNPALYASTPVTARMSPRVLGDVIKVVIDYARNNKASTGAFELIYKEPMQKLPAVVELELKGQPLQKSYFFDDPNQEMNNATDLAVSSPPSTNQTQDRIKAFGDEIKKTLKNLLQIIQNEKQRREIFLRRTENTTSVVSVK